MIEHRVEIQDSKGKRMTVLIRLVEKGRSSWQALNFGYFCYVRGVADSGYYPCNPLGWLSLFGGDVIDDRKLVLHLDDFRCDSRVNDSGTGTIYLQDYLLAEPGKLSWRLLVD